jgi:hypothetical protein
VFLPRLPCANEQEILALRKFHGKDGAMYEAFSLRPFFAQATKAEAEVRSPWVVKPTRVKPKKDDDDDGPTPTAGAAAWFLPFFRPRNGSPALA